MPALEQPGGRRPSQPHARTFAGPAAAGTADAVCRAAYLSADAQSLLRALLQKEAPKRLGYGEQGSAQVMAHPFFRHVAWTQLLQQKVGPLASWHGWPSTPPRPAPCFASWPPLSVRCHDILGAV